MKEIRLMTLTLKHFKCHDHLHLDFDGCSALVVGDNAAGKTTLSQSLTWLLYGRDGGAALEIRPLGPDGKLKDPQAITEVEAVLDTDGETHSFRRCCHRAGSQEGTTNEYYIDGVPCRRTAYLDQVNRLVPEEVFRLLTDLYRFSRDLTVQKRREILFGLMAICSDRQLLQSRLQFGPLLEAMGSLSLEDLEKKLNLSLKECTQASTDLPPRLSELETLLLGSDSRDYEALRRQRELLSIRLDAMGVPDHSAEKAAISLEIRELDLKNRAYMGEIQSALRNLETRLSLAKAKLSGLADPADLQNEREKLENQQAKEEEKTFDGFTCPACGQILPEALLEKAKEGFERERQKKIQDFLHREALLSVEEESLKASRQQLLSEVQTLQQQLDPLKPVRPMPGYEEQRKALQEKLERLNIPGETENLRRDLEKELSDLDRQLGREAMEKSAGVRMQKLRQDLQAAEKRESETRKLLDLIKDFRRYQAEFLEDSVNSRFRLARFRLFRETLDGGLEERCDVTYGGIPYGGLNTGARIRVGLDIVNTLSRYYGVRVPLFLDNAESVTYLPPQEGQVIRLRAVKDQKLEVLKEEW